MWTEDCFICGRAGCSTAMCFEREGGHDDPRHNSGLVTIHYCVQCSRAEGKHLGTRLQMLLAEYGPPPLPRYLTEEFTNAPPIL